jgi:hypothetical protein
MELATLESAIAESHTPSKAGKRRKKKDG